MKKFMVAVVVAVIAVLAYNYFNRNKTEAVSNVAVGSGLTSLTIPSVSKSTRGAAVFILQPGTGAIVNSPLTIKFGITNMQLVPAGQNQKNSGHHHLLLDLDRLPDLSQPLPASDNVIHFGKGQTETTIELTPGKHSLQLLLGDYLHIPHDKPVISKKITVTVE